MLGAESSVGRGMPVETCKFCNALETKLACVCGLCGRYNHPDIIITENGVCLPGEADASLPGVLNDVKRIEFHRDYVMQAMQAVATDKVSMCALFACKIQTDSC